MREGLRVGERVRGDEKMRGESETDSEQDDRGTTEKEVFLHSHGFDLILINSHQGHYHTN